MIGIYIRKIEEEKRKKLLNDSTEKHIATNKENEKQCIVILELHGVT